MFIGGAREDITVIRNLPYKERGETGIENDRSLNMSRTQPYILQLF